MSEEQEKAMDAGAKRLKERTREFALRTIPLHAVLPKSTVAQVLGRQLLRAGTSVGALVASVRTVKERQRRGGGEEP